LAYVAGSVRITEERHGDFVFTNIAAALGEGSVSIWQQYCTIRGNFEDVYGRKYCGSSLPLNICITCSSNVKKVSLLSFFDFPESRPFGQSSMPESDEVMMKHTY